MIIATAGHVDHGKTTLIRALTGVETDRLPEEKARGMTIDLGFAYLPAREGDGPEDTLGFIDVPGHERFVRNMLAGVAGIDFALLVVAADDGPMPQTREHLAILELLGVDRGAVALTKADRASESRIMEVEAAIRTLLAPTLLAEIPIVRTAAPQGLGIAPLLALLKEAQHGTVATRTPGHFRLAIDRAFVREGTGRIVTGTVYSGEMAVGETLVIAPSGLEVRVRAIHAQNQPAMTARAGQRCGIALAGAELRRYEIRRGDWLVAPALASPATRLGVRLTLARDETRALRDRAPVHLHLGAADLGARVNLLEAAVLEPGETRFAQLVLDAPGLAVNGDRFVLRDQSATRTLGGGTVLEAVPYPQNLSRARRLGVLSALGAPTASAQTQALVDALPEGLPRPWLARICNLPAPALDAVVDALALQSLDAERTGPLLVTAPRWAELQAQVISAVQAHQQREPAQTGIPEHLLPAALPGKIPPALLRASCEAVVRAGLLMRRAGHLCTPDHAPVLARADQQLLARVSAELARRGLQAPALHDIPESLGIDIEVLRPFMERMARLGHLHQVGRYRYYLPEILRQLACLAEALALQGEGGRFTAAEYRDHCGIGRNVTIELLEYFDRLGLTSRQGQVRALRQTPEKVFGR